MKKNKVVIIIPYFGAFPNYFDFWLKSAEYNSKFDFMIFTDNQTYKNYKNIKFINISFLKFKQLLQAQIEFPICLNEPYKLCDYKPVYGCALQNYISNYEFWGFGDVDLIYGNLEKFITPEVLKKYDKIYELGHLTLLRNIDKINYLWKIKHHLSNAYRYDEAFKTPYICHFDETDGLTQIAKFMHIKTYTSVDFGDIDRSKFNFYMFGKQNKIYPGVFFWEKGDLEYFYKNNTNILNYAVAYAHFQKRNCQIFCVNSSFSQIDFLIIYSK